MPTYEYNCKCGEAFEKIQSMSDEPYAECPKCNVRLRRSISGGQGIIFKGSGFYVNDYKDKGKNGSSEATTNNGANKEEGKSENKSEKKTESTSKNSSDSSSSSGNKSSDSTSASNSKKD